MRFSNRLDWSTRPNPISELLAARRGRGEEILDLTESNPTHAGIEYPAAEIAQAFADERAIRYEPTPAGIEEARSAVAGYYRERGFEVDPERILLTASTSEGYSYLFKLLADPGDEVLAPRPSYPLFEYLARLESVEIRQYPLFYDYGWHIDFGALEQAVTERTRAVVLVNPNNPTGSFLKQRELERLTELCAERGLAIISDEVFSDYDFDSAADRVASLVDVRGALTCSMSGMSKIAGLPQMKLGWMILNKRAALDRLELIADTYLSVGTPVQLAAARLLEARKGIQRQISARTHANLAHLRRVAHTMVVEGGWYAVLPVPRVRSEDEWALDLLGRGVLVQPGYFYDFESEAYLVVSLLTPEPVFREGIARCLELMHAAKC